MLRLEYNLKAVPNHRPRAFSSGKYKHTIKMHRADSDTIFQDTIKVLTKIQLPRDFKVFENEALYLYMNFYFKKPKTNKKKYHTQRPDLTNLAKNVEDAYNGLIFKDDCQITELTISKQFCTHDKIVVSVGFL